MTKPSLAIETLPLTPAILRAVDQVVAAELLYERASDCGRKFGITGEVGEILVCKALGLELVKDPRSEGFDAVDRNGRRVQIKTRRSERNELPKETGRLSRFSDHDFDYAILVILSRDYKLAEVWQVDSAKLKPIIAKHKRANPTIRQFKALGTKVDL